MEPSKPFQPSHPVQDALALADANLKIARSTQDRKQALEYCRAAKKELARIDDLTSSTRLDQIIAAHRENGRVLESLGLGDEAILSYTTADELKQYIPSAQFPSTSTNIALPKLSSPPQDTLIHDGTPVPLIVPIADQSPLALHAPDAPGRGTPAVPLGVSSTSQLALLSPIGSTSSSHNVLELVPTTIFALNFQPHLFKGIPPKPDEALTDTRQLAYCLALLKASPSSDDALNEPTRTWLHNTRANEDEQERLRTLAVDILLEFMRDGLKDEEATAEMVCIAPVLESDNFRSLFGIFVVNFKADPLLRVHSLEGLNRIIQCAPPDSMDPDGLIEILEYVKLCLQDTQTQSSDRVCRLMRTVSHILDAMVDGNIKGSDRKTLHNPVLLLLTNIEKELEKNTDPYLVFQAAYASQALMRISDEKQKTAHPITGTAARETAGLFSIAESINTDVVADAVQGGPEKPGHILGAVSITHKHFSALERSGQDLREALRASFTRKRAWYPILRGIDALLQNGELTKVKAMVCNAPCRSELAFQWGVCQRLGSLAADPIWDTDSQEGAVAFLSEIYQNDAVWGQETIVKRCILDILMQLATTSGSAKQAADSLLRKLENDTNEGKQALYNASRKEGPSSHLLKAALPLSSSSPLLDRVQMKIAVEADLRNLARNRLEELSDTLYIAPEAKAYRQAADDDLFDLTTKVKEFLDSEKKVMLIWGDSGAGKSTFNRKLERELWNNYNNRKDRDLRKEEKIPIFVSLAAIDMPESDLIGHQLRKAHFSDAQIQDLKANRNFVLICDGYDEYQQGKNLYIINRLNQSGQWKTQMVISCRSEYLSNEYRHIFRPEDRDGQKGEALLQEAVMAPFSKEQIQAYIEQHVAKEAAQWEAKDYLRVFEQNLNLQKIVTNPFMLMLSLKVLPNMTYLGPSVKITRVILYDEFVEQWIEQGKERLIERELVWDEKKAFDTLSDDSFSQKAMQFVKDLAVAIFKNQNGNPIVEYSPDRENDTWKVEFFGPDDDKKLLREASPLRRDGNLHQFIHQSILEYGIARAIFDPQQTGEFGTRGQDTVDTVRERSECQGVSVVTVPAPDNNSPLLWRNFVDKPAVLQFLAERVLREPVFEQQLYDFIEYSKTDEKWCTAAANAITILVRARVRFNGEDLRGIRIPGADLTGGLFDYVQLQGADLRDVNLCNVWLRHANLDNAQMSGAQFGEWPHFFFRGVVQSCVYSPDGKTFAVGGSIGESYPYVTDGRNCSIGTIDVYGTATWEKIHTLNGHTKGVCSVMYSPSGHQIASGSRDGTVRLWNVQTGASGLILSGHADIVWSVTYSPGGHCIATGSRDATVRLWDAQTGEPGIILSGHTSAVRSVAYSPSGRQIVSGSEDNTVRLWDAKTGASGPSLNGHTRSITSVAYSPSAHQIASGSEDKTLRLWDAQTGAPGLILRGHVLAIFSVAYSPSGHQIASGGQDNTLWIWDTQTGAPNLVLDSQSYTVRSVAFSPGGHQIASGGRGQTVMLWNAQTGAPGSILGRHTDVITGVTNSRRGYLVASANYDRTVRVWDAPTGGSNHFLGGHTYGVTSVTYSPSGHEIASGSSDKRVRLWDAQTGTPSLVLSGHTDMVTSVAYSPSGHQIASGSWDKTVRLWDTLTGMPHLILSGHSHGVTSAAYSPNGRQIVSGSLDSTVRLWDTQTGALGLILVGHTATVTSVAFSPSGHQIASGGNDKVVRLWDAQTGAPGPTLSNFYDVVTTVAYSPSGHQIAIGNVNRVVDLWDAQTGTHYHALNGHKNVVTSVAYSPSGHYIVSASRDKTVQLWNTSSGNCPVVVTDERVSSLAWKPTLNGLYFATGCENSVRTWQVIEGVDGYCQVRLLWSSMNEKLSVSDTSIQNVQGLCRAKIRLLKQRGAVGDPTMP